MLKGIIGAIAYSAQKPSIKLLNTQNMKYENIDLETISDNGYWLSEKQLSKYNRTISKVIDITRKIVQPQLKELAENEIRNITRENRNGKYLSSAVIKALQRIKVYYKRYSQTLHPIFITNEERILALYIADCMELIGNIESEIKDFKEQFGQYR